MSSSSIIEAGIAQLNLGSTMPECPRKRLEKYHHAYACLSKPSRPPEGHEDRNMIYHNLLQGGIGASLVPDTKTISCPFGDVQSLESPKAVKGFDTTWIVENTSAKDVVLAWIVDGFEYSPFHPDLNPMEDYRAILRPGDWTSVPTFESFVYHAREIEEDGSLGRVVLQYRAGMIPLGANSGLPRDEDIIDPEPFFPESVGTAEQPDPRLEEVGRRPTNERPCNIIDIGFRNESGQPLAVFWANQLTDVPGEGFSCAETYSFHLGTHTAPQDFMFDWGSRTKYEGSAIGHTFVARLASDPNVVIDTYTLQTTKIVDCPSQKINQVVMAPTENSELIDVQDTESCPNDTTNGSGRAAVAAAFHSVTA
eukprot:CAMPEP_0201118810 /NCGR_PEP_ID=MMETSP0850-20130426/2998_1 /ASSEMBLY_ACC=CAM_ASM_000622 /TAXON_ID=183588 /ORGANISM="Pseudo-nitzschia fraudulenta, Strain WWA7" /LENGTH=365 /DNA_ID=CAMNT_0047384245 /DNA_START=39 /DNA_END=1136 /DNA_ORIENTATION=-